MTSRSLITGGAPPSFTIPNPATADDGKVLAYAAATGSCAWTSAPVAVTRGTGQLVFAAAVGTGEFIPGAYEFIVQTFPLGGKLVTLAFKGVSTMAVGKTFAGAGNTLVGGVDPSLTPTTGALIVGSATSFDGTTSFTTKVYVTAGATIGMINVGGANYADGAGSVDGFSVSYLLPTSFEYLDQAPYLSIVSPETGRQIEELVDTAAESGENHFELLTDPDVDRTRTWVEVVSGEPLESVSLDIGPTSADRSSGEVSEEGSDFSFESGRQVFDDCAD